MNFSSLPDKPSSRGKRRHDRAEELIAHEAAEFIARESNGTSLITVTRVELSDRGTRAVVFVSVFPDEKSRTALEFLNRNGDAFRAHLKSRARLRDIPHIVFEEDAGEKNRQHLDELGKT